MPWWASISQSPSPCYLSEVFSEETRTLRSHRYWLSIFSVASHYKLQSLKQHKLTISQLRKSEKSKRGIIGLKAWCRQGWAPSGGAPVSHSLPRLASRGHHFLSILKAHHSNLCLYSSDFFLLFSNFSPFASHLWGPLWYGATKIISPSQNLNLITFAKSFFSYKVTYSQVWRLGQGYLWWPFSACHTYIASTVSVPHLLCPHMACKSFLSVSLSHIKSPGDFI